MDLEDWPAARKDLETLVDIDPRLAMRVDSGDGYVELRKQPWYAAVIRKAKR
jgi:hypothetical protein